ncbi:hypothetical protein M7I_2219 [Glarea lozoyensis 74030]|uniref:Uncharacterized protein n=1 Tax=Glarea lozoyensis (strain ATCC 74030 / MF5533) TaxID=1104152 RepID=H0EI69_GLAL7|nr:hypothetical protein M7I_2219 [Glarea lozoyensis 74030]
MTKLRETLSKSTLIYRLNNLVLLPRNLKLTQFPNNRHLLIKPLKQRFHLFITNFPTTTRNQTLTRKRICIHTFNPQHQPPSLLPSLPTIKSRRNLHTSIQHLPIARKAIHASNSIPSIININNHNPFLSRSLPIITPS